MIKENILPFILQSPGFMGWKDKHLRYMGCNHNFATMLQIQDPSRIIGLSDYDLIDYTEDSFLFHRSNDLLALAGKTVQCLHVSTTPYDGTVFNIIKKPLLNNREKVIGVIFHCSPFHQAEFHKLLSYNSSAVDKPFVNIYKLSKRELECLSYLLQGKNVREISIEMTVSKRTIETYIDNIKSKFHCRTKTEVIIKAIYNGYMQK